MGSPLRRSDGSLVRKAVEYTERKRRVPENLDKSLLASRPWAAQDHVPAGSVVVIDAAGGYWGYCGRMLNSKTHTLTPEVVDIEPVESRDC
jgi:hypothetical protein